ncbi:MAG: YdeI/OmpD-associated family protein [Chloroflexi bacterium]|nr:YdeI/OmpD-associated family protein [Chloroflexota bacterium]
MTLQTFEVDTFEKAGGHVFIVPFSVEAVFGSKALTLVKGTINGYPYRSSVFPLGDGTHYMVVNREVREAIDKLEGGHLLVTMELDTNKRVVEVPADFQSLLAENEQARRFFEKLSYSHQKEYVDWIVEAKRQETRKRRMEQAVEMLGEGKKQR